MSLPFAGKVTASTAELGQMLSRGQSFGRVFAVDSLEVTVPIGPKGTPKSSPGEGRTAFVYVGRGAMPDPISYEATVVRVAAELDERTRFSKLYLRLNGNPNVSPGTFIDVKVVGPTVAKSLQIPESAEQGGGAVWIVRNKSWPVFRRRFGVVPLTASLLSVRLRPRHRGGRCSVRIHGDARTSGKARLDQ
ncbi:MAG: hypothetical protein CM1200mP9_05870 [Gammaproteobacteria bacterium]|nr:MAG: hypothetical protein CM1200mP9_05870 [Gammaproteobacteria bacterium]